MPGQKTFDDTFAVLRRLLRRHARQLQVVVDTPDELQLASRTQRDRLGRPLFVAAVQRRKNYVSFHLMPIYTHPTLLDSLSPGLRKRMQGKSCFNFKSIDAGQSAELRGLIKDGLERFETIELPWADTGALEKKSRKRQPRARGV